MSPNNGSTDKSNQKLTIEEIHRQQRANLALRTMDLETDNIMLHQEVERLKVRVAELESSSSAENLTVVKPSNLAKQSVQ